MCNHIMIKVNDLNVCAKCGMTLADGKVVFDRGLLDYIKSKEKNKKKKKKL